MSESFDLNPVDRITSGAVGEPGERVFYIQARQGERLVTLVCEKQQVEALATTLERLLDAMPEVEDEGAPVADEDLDLEDPLIPEWRVGPMGIELEEESDMIVLLLHEAVEDQGEEEEEEIPEGASARFVATRAQMRALAEQSASVVAAGRPRCRLCGFPLDPAGDHVCPALNGHRAPETP